MHTDIFFVILRFLFKKLKTKLSIIKMDKFPKIRFRKLYFKCNAVEFLLLIYIY